MTKTLNRIATIRLMQPFAKSPMMAVDDENAIVGTIKKSYYSKLNVQVITAVILVANGNCNAYNEMLINFVQVKEICTNHDCVQIIVHLRNLLDFAEKCDTKSWQHSNCSSHQNSLPSLPLQVQKAFHCKLSAISSSHSRALTRC